MSTPAIETSGLTKIYRDVRAISDLKLSVPRGSVYGFLGRNSAGKTTTIKILLGLARATSGSARVLGLDAVRDNLAILERTAFVGEHKNLMERMTAAELVRFNKGFYPKWNDAVVERCARRLEIPMNQPFRKLSKGTRAKVWLMLSVAQAPDLMLLDEPTSGLDPVVKDEFLKLLVEEHTAEGRTVFFSSHDLAEIEQVADRIGILHEGKLLLDASLEDMRENFRLVIAAGANLPPAASVPMASYRSEGAFCRYVLTRDSQQFVAALEAQGATVTANTSIGLREVFLELARNEEEPCISGNAGATIAPRSLSFSR